MERGREYTYYDADRNHVTNTIEQQVYIEKKVSL